jgi:cyclopropane fatty-acyl-phospholipid synthase-like methyltransferase
VSAADEETFRRPEDVFRPETGRTYKEFWSNVSADKEGAYLGVAGMLFDRPYDDDDMSFEGAAVAEILANELGITGEHAVLEIGVGVGRIAEHLAPRCARFHGVDIAAGMIEVASRRLAGLDNVRLEVLERSDLSCLPDASFDRVYAQIVLIHLDREDVFNYLREAYRVLAPGGRAWFQTNNLLHRGGTLGFVAAADEIAAVGQANRGRVHFLTAPELRHYVELAGFRVVEERSHLEPVEQHYDFVVPNVQWDHFLVAVVEKPREAR